MSINFMVPNDLKNMFQNSANHLGIKLDIDKLISDIVVMSNKKYQRLAVEEMYLGIIPDDLPVWVMHGHDVADINTKYNLPNAANSAAAIMHNADTSHDVVLYINIQHLRDKSIVNHELVHYAQIKDGYLKVNTSEAIWCKNGELFVLDLLKDMDERIRLCDNDDALMMYEISKPWELEAYALTELDDQLNLMSDQFKQAIYQYRELHGIVVEQN